MRTASIARTTLAALVLGCALAACASPGGNAAANHAAAPAPSAPAPSAPARSSAPSPSAAVPPDVAVVRLAAGFSPSALRLGVGQQFLVTVSPSVQARGLDIAGCASGSGGTAAGGLLTVRCTGGGYLYTAEHQGTAALSATVGPRCSPGQMCPQWVSEATLHLTIT